MPRKGEIRAEKLEPGHYIYRGRVIKREVGYFFSGPLALRASQITTWEVDGFSEAKRTFREAKQMIDESLKGQK